LEKLLGGHRLGQILKLLSNNPSVGLVGPEGHFVSMKAHYGANEERVLVLGRRLGLSENAISQQGFFAGSMFAARVSAIKPLLEFGFEDSDFESEQGQRDGTLAHALERIFSLSVHAAGMRIVAIDESSNIARNKYPFAKTSNVSSSRYDLTPLEIKLRAAWRHPTKSWKRKAFRAMYTQPPEGYLEALQLDQKKPELVEGYGRNSSALSALDGKRIAVLYLARSGAGALDRFNRFVQSYKDVPARIEHDLFVIFKGFQAAGDMEEAENCFSQLDYRPLHTDDDNFDLGAYRLAVEQIDHEYVCFLNSNSELVGDGWLAKLVANLSQPGVGLVGATGSYESLAGVDRRFPLFPNMHIRSNAFAIRREHFRALMPLRVPGKLEAFLLESGEAGLTRRINDMGLSALVVGRNGRGYPPLKWPLSETFRQGEQSNLLVHDNVTRDFQLLPSSEKQIVIRNTWGNFYPPDMAGYCA
jgi:hypothetical protein